MDEPPNKKSKTEVPDPEATEIDEENQVEEPPHKKRKHTKPPEKVAEGEGVERSGAEGDLDKSNEDPTPPPDVGIPPTSPMARARA